MMHAPIFLPSLSALFTTAALACGGTKPEQPAIAPADPGDRAYLATGPWSKPSDEALKKRLTPLQFNVTQNDATEPAFDNPLHDNKEPGLYVDIVSGEPLFASSDKFDSGTGWPSFTQPIHPSRVVLEEDGSYGMSRVEVRSKSGDSHLGHVFTDGPAPTGLRYCINAASLRFIPAAELEAAGYGPWRPRVEDRTKPAPPIAKEGQPMNTEIAMLAGGCFWGMEEIIRKIPGVITTQVGYTGGKSAEPSYDDVRQGTTGHAESVRIVFDPTKLSYADLLEKWFFRMHDPTTLNRQGNDVGAQYRSAIFATSPEQTKIAQQIRDKVDASGLWDRPIVTEIVDAGAWTDAEDYHQDYLQKNPNGYTCHYMR